MRGPLSSLLSQPFLGGCLLKGGFSALVINAPSDQGNSFAVLPSRVLLLSLDRESFQARPRIHRCRTATAPGCMIPDYVDCVDIKFCSADPMTLKSKIRLAAAAWPNS